MLKWLAIGADIFDGRVTKRPPRLPRVRNLPGNQSAAAASRVSFAAERRGGARDHVSPDVRSPESQPKATPVRRPPATKAPGGEMAVRIPDDSDFSSFKAQCLGTQGWSRRYHKGGVTVWCRPDDGDGVQKIKMRMACGGVSAETLYDVLHDGGYRRKWDSNMIDAYDIGGLTVNADVGYYSWRCPGPLKNRDFVTLRSWLPLGDDFLIINSSVKHAQHPPKKDFVRAVSLLTGYYVQSGGAAGSSLYYLSQLDPRGSLPKWVVNRVSQFVAPKAMRKLYKASQKYPEWKRRHEPHLKPWRFPEQSALPRISVSELTPQRADSLENIDESGLSEDKTKRGDDDDET